MPEPFKSEEVQNQWEAWSALALGFQSWKYSIVTNEATDAMFKWKSVSDYGVYNIRWIAEVGSLPIIDMQSLEPY